MSRRVGSPYSKSWLGIAHLRHADHRGDYSDRPEEPQRGRGDARGILDRQPVSSARNHYAFDLRKMLAHRETKTGPGHARP
jgi:hypothetical protein